MQRVSSRHHIIIGDGLAAAEFAKSTCLQPSDRLTIIGPNSKDLGRGLAYAKVPADRAWHLAYLLNSPSEAVGPDFARWLHNNWETIAKRMQGRQPDWLADGQAYISQGDYSALNAPRELFGDYLCASVNQALNTLTKQGTSVQRIAAYATDIEYDVVDKQFHVLLDTGDSLVASQVDIATGGAQTQSAFDADGQYSFAQLYGHEDAIAERVQHGGTIVCLGTNAAMLDTLRLCQSVLRGSSLDFLALSPNAQLPEPLIPCQPRKHAMLSLQPGYDNAQDLINAVSTQMASFRRQGYRMADMRGSFKTAIVNAGLDTLLADPMEARKVLGLMERLFLRGTRDSLADFKSLRNKNEVRLLAGRLIAMKTDANALQLSIAHRDGTQEKIPATALVNCTGVGKTPRFDHMTETLLKKAWLTRCPVSGGLEVGEKLHIGPAELRYLSPAVTTIGEKVLAFSLYDAAGISAQIKAARRTIAL